MKRELLVNFVKMYAKLNQTEEVEMQAMLEQEEYRDVQEQELFKDGSRVRVQGKVCEALMILVENPGEVVTRETLRARLWPADTHINYDANVNTTVNKLRQVLGDSPDRQRPFIPQSL